MLRPVAAERRSSGCGTSNGWRRAGLPTEDTVGKSHDPTVLGLPESHLQTGHGEEFGIDQILQHVSRTDRRQLVRVPHQEKMSLRRDGPDQSGGQAQVEHTGFIHDHKIAGQGTLLIVGEASLTRVELEQAVNRLSEMRSALRHAPGGSAGRRAQHNLGFLGLENGYQGPQNGGFSHIGAS